MAYDEALAEALRGMLRGVDGLSEKKMFGGLGFFINGNMLCAADKGRYVFRVGKGQEAAALKRPGAMIGLFLIGYGLARSVVELARQPDAFFQSATNPLGHALQFSDAAGLTMGQILSLPMIAAGIGFVLLSRRRGAAEDAPGNTRDAA